MLQAQHAALLDAWQVGASLLAGTSRLMHLAHRANHVLMPSRSSNIMHADQRQAQKGAEKFP